MIQKGQIIFAVPGCEERFGGGAWARGCRACASGVGARVSDCCSIEPNVLRGSGAIVWNKNYYSDGNGSGVLQLSDSRPSVAAVVSAEDITAQSASPDHIAAAAA